MVGMVQKFVFAGAVALLPLGTAILWSQGQQPIEGTIVPGSMKVSYGGEPLIQELIERRVIGDAVKAAIRREDFAALDAMGNKFRLSRSRTESGLWNLAEYHAQILAELEPGSEDQCDNGSDDFLRRWLAKSPNQPGPYIARAAVFEAQAWCVRGGGYADTVRAQAFRHFAAKVDEARTFLEENRSVASVDPQYYAVLARIFIDQGVEKAEFMQLLDEASSREPNYHQTYLEAYRYFQPRWHGSHSELDEMARYATTRTTSDEGSGMYARYYWSVLHCECDDFQQSIDWPTMRQSMQALMTRYPSDWNAANFARISCAMNDAQQARGWFARVKGDYTGAFDDMAEMQRCQEMAQPLERSRARCPYAAREGWPPADVDRYCRLPEIRSRSKADSAKAASPGDT